MTDRATARHRAPQRASTPLTTITTGITAVVGDRFETIGRTGAVLAVSSGLVATMGLPASASPAQVVDTTGPQTASLPLSRAGMAPTSEVLASDLVAGNDVLTASALTADAPIAAPDTATVQFEPGLLRADLGTQLLSRTQARASRDQARAALAAKAKDAARPAVVKQRSANKTTTGPSTSSGSSNSSSSNDSASNDSNGSGSSSGDSSSSGSSSNAPLPAARGSAVVALASRYIGVMYLYGGSTPRGFDCSGLTQYVYKQLGVSIPRTADQQLHAVRRISRSEAQPGDLVFFVYGGYASHVGIYAGGNMMIDAPRTGKSISKRAIYSSSVVFGRVV